MGIDLGTGGVRCVLIHEDGSVFAEVSRRLSRQNLSTSSGESEQDPFDWVAILEDAMDELFSVPQNRFISSFAVDSTSGTILPVSQEGRPLGSALLHNDMRSVDEAKACSEIFEGNCSPSFSLPKILWLRKNRFLPDDAVFFHATDYLNSWLSGRVDLPTDFTNAMKTGLDLETCDWHRALPRLNLPRIVRPGVAIGELAITHRKRWGIEGPAILVSGATDSNAAFYASGAGKIGHWSTTIGTTLAIKGLSSIRVLDESGCIYCHRHPDGPWLPGGASNAGGEILLHKLGSDLLEIERKVIRSSVVPSLVYPSIRTGERLPFADPLFQPFAYVDCHHQEEFYMGCLEGLAFVERLSYELLKKLGAEVGEVIFATGGGVGSELGLQMRADVLARTVLVPKYPNSAMGAAILAASGYYSRPVGELSTELVSITRKIEPCDDLDGSREDRFFKFGELCLENSK